MQLRERVAFDELVPGAPKAIGGVEKVPTERFRMRASITYLRGGEKVLAGRLAGSQTIVVTVRASTATKAVTTDWELRNLGTAGAFNIRNIEPNRKQPRLFLDMICETKIL